MASLTAAEAIAKALLSMSRAEVGRVDILHGDYHESDFTGRPAIRRQLADLLALHMPTDRDPNDPTTQTPRRPLGDD